MGLSHIGRRNDSLAYTDASLADCKASIFTGGYVIRLFGDTIAWQTKKQNYVALSICESEYVAMGYACKDLMALHKSLKRKVHENLLPAPVLCDNRAAIACEKRTEEIASDIWLKRLKTMSKNAKETNE